jgi:hypothetical protein
MSRAALHIAIPVENHLPGEVGDFPGAQSSFQRQLDNQPVPNGMPGRGRKHQEIVASFLGQYLCLPAGHRSLSISGSESQCI